MELSIRRWRPGQLLASWATYWVGLAAATLGPAASVVWRATHLPEGHGTINAGFNNSTLSFTVIEEGLKTFEASASVGTVLAWLIGPPLALWLVWLAVRERPAGARGLQANANDRLSAGTAPASEWRVDRDDRMPVERESVRTPNP
jgi:Na+/glutamate symporter